MFNTEIIHLQNYCPLLKKNLLINCLEKNTQPHLRTGHVIYYTLFEFKIHIKIIFKKMLKIYKVQVNFCHCTLSI